MKILFFLTIISLIIFLDQITKIIIRNMLLIGETWPENWSLLHFSHIENTGAAFGIMTNMNAFLLVFSFILISSLIIYKFKANVIKKVEIIPLALVIGGGTGNIIDRIIFGSVTDFIDPIYYPAFNVADSSIVIGISIYIVTTLISGIKNDKTS